MRAMDDEAFKEHSSDLLLVELVLRIREQTEQYAGEIEGVVIRVTQLIGDHIKQLVSPLVVRCHHEAFEEVDGGGVLQRCFTLHSLNTRMHHYGSQQRDVVRHSSAITSRC